jgi:hypothetical protein
LLQITKLAMYEQPDHDRHISGGAVFDLHKYHYTTTDPDVSDESQYVPGSGALELTVRKNLGHYDGCWPPGVKPSVRTYTVPFGELPGVGPEYNLIY